jgi:hypothetical protein
MRRNHDGKHHQQRFSEVLGAALRGFLDTKCQALARQPLSGEVNSESIGYSPTSLRFRPGGGHWVTTGKWFASGLLVGSARLTATSPLGRKQGTNHIGAVTPKHGVDGLISIGVRAD